MKLIKHTDKWEARFTDKKIESSSIAKVINDLYDLGYNLEELMVAVRSMQDNNHRIASFGVDKTFICTLVK